MWKQGLSLCFGKSATESQLSTHDASWTRALRAAGILPLGSCGGIVTGPQHGSQSHGADPGEEAWGVLYPTRTTVLEEQIGHRGLLEREGDAGRG